MNRPEFREWLDRQPKGDEPTLPLMHTTKALIARDIVREGRIEPRDCVVMGGAVAYFFYGRPAYRVGGEPTVTQNAMCPVCFVFSSELISTASNIYPFDTGAFNARLYKHSMMDEIDFPNYDIGSDVDRIGRLVRRIFGTNEIYYDGDKSKIRLSCKDAEPDEYLAQSYIDLITSRGRNEPDDRVGTVEVVFKSRVPLIPGLLAIVVPDNIWNKTYSADWLKPLNDGGVQILPYRHVMGREPSHYRDAIEVMVREFIFPRDDT